jgi:D-alanyl-D-alanine carboxypeptidase
MSFRAVLALGLVASLGAAACSHTASEGDEADEALERAMDELVAMPAGPPGVIVVVQRGGSRVVHTAGVAEVASGVEPSENDHMRIASVAKAFSGAVALSLVGEGRLSLDDTIGMLRPDLPKAFREVTVRQLLNHTSGVPDFIKTDDFVPAFLASPDVAPPPRELLSFIEDEPLVFPPGSRYAYSNSENIIVGLIAEAVTGGSYADALATQVYEPLDLDETSLPDSTELPAPTFHGYDIAPPDPPEDITNATSAGWAWASGGVLSTPEDLNDFIRGYVGGELFGADVQEEQRTFIPGAGSEPTGPGENSGGLALFRYDTACGTVYGHTGNTLGYTQFAAASSDGRRSATASMNLQRTHTTEGYGREVWAALHHVEELAVCAAMAGA